MEETSKKKLNKMTIIIILISAAVTAVLIAAAGMTFFAPYYRADQTALDALVSDEVNIAQTDYGWFFDGPSEDNALIFYPGMKVEETAYAPLLHKLAAQGLDIFLVQMPLHTALLGVDRATAIMERYDYDEWYIGGHSMGGAMACEYASGHGGEIDGVILFAAYPVKKLPEDYTEIILVGSEDKVINRERLAAGRQYSPDDYTEVTVVGGNHSQFGSYGIQPGDGVAYITAEEQVDESVEAVTEALHLSDDVPGTAEQ